MEWSSILVWVVAASCTLSFVEVLRRFRGRYAGWLAVYAALALSAVVLRFVWPEGAGWVAFGLWAIFTVVPALAIRRIQLLVGRQRYTEAKRLWSVVRWLHPMDGWRERPAVLEALGLVKEGREEEAITLLEGARVEGGPLSRAAALTLFGQMDRWDEAVRWVEENVPRHELAREPNLLPGYVRALGETRQLDGMLAAYDEHCARNPALVDPARSMTQVFVVAFCGRAEVFERLVEGAEGQWSAELVDSWRAVTLQAAGETERARALLETLADGASDPSVARRARGRIERPLSPVPAASLGERARDVLESLEREIEHRARFGSIGRPTSGPTTATRTLVVLTLLVYALELRGGPTDAENLHRLGALVVGAPLEAWRLLCAVFLHFGSAHLAANLLGLWIFGRYVERLLGSVRMLLGYLACGVGADGLFWAIAHGRDQQPAIVVGASGAVMALFGMVLVSAVRGWLRYRSPLALRQMGWILVVLALQTIFDLVTPRVSFLVHGSGTLLGILWGLAWPGPRDPEARPEEQADAEESPGSR